MIVFVLRHADRHPEPADDLNAAGERRAEALAHVLADCDVSAAFHSDTVRAARTLEPLKRKLGPALALKEIATIAAVVDAARALPPAAVAVIVGHSNTVGPIVERLGGETIPDIGATEFDRLYALVTDAVGHTSVLRLRYGAQT